MHLRNEPEPLLVALDFGRRPDGLELQARVVAIGFHCECGERQEVYAVAFFQSCHVGKAKRQAKDDGDAGVLTGCGSHPEGIVVAPLQVEVVASQEIVHDDVCARTAIEDVAKDV